MKYPVFCSSARINIGRIAALLAYCYHLCRTYISNHLASSYGLLSFLAMVSGWLFQFLIKAKFYEWLAKQGGWVSARGWVFAGGRGGGGWWIVSVGRMETFVAAEAYSTCTCSVGRYCILPCSIIVITIITVI